jgi:hypothetical protein
MASSRGGSSPAWLGAMANCLSLERCRPSSARRLHRRPGSRICDCEHRDTPQKPPRRGHRNNLRIWCGQTPGRIGFGRETVSAGDHVIPAWPGTLAEDSPSVFGRPCTSRLQRRSNCAFRLRLMGRATLSQRWSAEGSVELATGAGEVLSVRLRSPYWNAQGSQPREQGISPSAIVRPRESLYRTGVFRSVQSQGRSRLDRSSQGCRRARRSGRPMRSRSHFPARCQSIRLSPSTLERLQCGRTKV